MRDHTLKNKIGQIEDKAIALSQEIRVVSLKAEREGALAHAKFYEEIADQLDRAANELARAYSTILNGNDDVPALDDE